MPSNTTLSLLFNPSIYSIEHSCYDTQVSLVGSGGKNAMIFEENIEFNTSLLSDFIKCIIAFKMVRISYRVFDTKVSKVWDILIITIKRQD